MLFSGLGRIHPTRGTPDRAVMLITGWSVILALSGTYDQLLTFVTFAVLVFSIAGGLALFVLRRTKPDALRPYRAFGYPVLPAIFVVTTAALAINVLIVRPQESLIGLLLVSIGIPVYAVIDRRRRTF
jgi:APA family basic amino acid/polyamine antiporter